MNETRGTTKRQRRVRRSTVLAVMVAIFSVAGTACLPPPQPPADAVITGVFNATNRDRAGNGVRVLRWSPSSPAWPPIGLHTSPPRTAGWSTRTCCRCSTAPATRAT